MAYIIAEPCYWHQGHGLCGRLPVDCIHPKKDTTYEDGRPAFEQVPQLYIDPTVCIDCGACVPVCPVTAIFAEADLPEKWNHFVAINASYVDAAQFLPDKYTKQA